MIPDRFLIVLQDELLSCDLRILADRLQVTYVIFREMGEQRQILISDQHSQLHCEMHRLTVAFPLERIMMYEKKCQ